MTDSAREDLLRRCGRRFGELGFAIAWTRANEGENAKICGHGWKDVRPLTNATMAEGLFAERGKRRNPAVVLRPSGLVGVETDSEADLEHFHSLDLPKTLTVRSSAPDRLHFYFRRPNAPLVGFRFESGGVTGDRERYFVAPPALHPSGEVYSFAGRDGFEREPAELSAEDYAKLTKLAMDTDAEHFERLANTEDPIPEGRRRETIFRAACSQRAFGVPKHAILESMLELNRTRCQPPLTDSQVKVQVDGIDRYVEGSQLPADDRQVRHEVVRFGDALKKMRDEPMPEPIAWGPLMTVDYHRGLLYTLGGYGGDGKTSFALQTACEFGRKGLTVRIFSLEMTWRQVARRMAAIELGKDPTQVADTELDAIADWDVGVIDDSSPDGIYPYLDCKPDLIVFDHIHLTDFGDRRDIERKIRQFKEVAKEIDTTFLCLAQLKEREAHGTAYPRPIGNQLRESRMLVNTSDVVFFVWRERDENELPTNSTEVIVTKDRYGEPRVRYCTFEGARQRFVPRAVTAENWHTFNDMDEQEVQRLMVTLEGREE